MDFRCFADDSRWFWLILMGQEQKQAIHERFSQARKRLLECNSSVREDRHLWERRPLPVDMVEYALEADIKINSM